MCNRFGVSKIWNQEMNINFLISIYNINRDYLLIKKEKRKGKKILVKSSVKREETTTMLYLSAET